jgi:cytoskeletal protein CcmA (bactofilin family)
MFGKKDANQDKLAVQKAMTMIGQGTSVQGDMASDGDIRVDGGVKGALNSRSKIVVGNTGTVEGDLYCQNATIEGRVKGNIHVQELLILSKTAFVDGDILMKKLVVEEGARFNGKCSMAAVSKSYEADKTMAKVG